MASSAAAAKAATEAKSAAAEMAAKATSRTARPVQHQSAKQASPAQLLAAELQRLANELAGMHDLRRQYKALEEEATADGLRSEVMITRLHAEVEQSAEREKATNAALAEATASLAAARLAASAAEAQAHAEAQRVKHAEAAHAVLEPLAKSAVSLGVQLEEEKAKVAALEREAAARANVSLSLDLARAALQEREGKEDSARAALARSLHEAEELRPEALAAGPLRVQLGLERERVAALQAQAERAAELAADLSLARATIASLEARVADDARLALLERRLHTSSAACSGGSSSSSLGEFSAPEAVTASAPEAVTAEVEHSRTVPAAGVTFEAPDAATRRVAPGPRTGTPRMLMRAQARKAATRIQWVQRSRTRSVELGVRLALRKADPQEVAAACASGGLDALAAVVHKQLGADAWLRATHNAPDEWEEEDFVGAISKALSDPARAPEVWLLAKPTKYVRAPRAGGSVRV